VPIAATLPEFPIPRGTLSKTEFALANLRAMKAILAGKVSHKGAADCGDPEDTPQQGRHRTRSNHDPP